MQNHTNAVYLHNKIEGASQNHCPVHATIDILAGKWKMQVLWQLKDGIKRFGEIKNAIPAITPAVLSTQLHDLATDGIIERHLYAEVPPRTEYALTPTGQSLVSVICAMETWGIQYLQRSNTPYDSQCLWNNNNQ